MSIFLYNLFLFAYAAGIRLVAPWNKKASLWLKGRHRLFQDLEKAGFPAGKRVIWMHCASLGEFEQGRPLLKSLREHFPDHFLLLTFFSPSGFEVRRDYPGVDRVSYLPLDSKQNARRFLELVNPSLVVWIKYDYWYYYLTEIHSRKIPVLLVSAIFRPDQAFFRRYGKPYRRMLDCFTAIFVQNEASQRLLAGIGLLENVAVSGDTRFDRVVDIAAGFTTLDRIASFCGGATVIVAGSTWEEDEEELDHYANTHPAVKFIVAPHEIEEVRLREVEALFQNSIRYSRWNNEAPPGKKAPNVLIIDNIGMLSSIYHYASIAYVGGGFGDDGVHNVLEAAVYGKPVLMGPVIEKFAEAVELVETGGGIVIESALEAERVFDRLFGNPEELAACNEASRSYVYSKLGATSKIIGYIQENRLLTT